jgi:NAD-dependent dihydropyrimidine dehydrogenase PreA subunit
MAEPQKALWHGIPRQEIPWFPTVDPQACIGCSLCFVTCGRGVYDLQERKAVTLKPYECMVGCTTCAMVCPTDAIAFPDRAVVQRVEREHQILKAVREEAKAKKTKQSALMARATAEDAVAKVDSRVHFEVAGLFGEKRFLVQLEEFLEDHPLDILQLKLEVPTVRGAHEGAPAFLSFEVTSTQQADIQNLLPGLRDLIRRNDLVLIQEARA